MDKYEYNLKIDQMRAAIAKKDGAKAASIADEFDWKRERDASLLVSVADAYELNKEYAKAKEILISAYEKTPSSKNIAYRLTLLAANTKEFDEAMEFYQDFVELAPRDTSRYILQYRISRAQNMPKEELICILEEFLEDEMEEKWMFELAKLYHEAGYVDKCIDLCDEMSLWFSHGKYVRRALDLKKLYRPLSKSQEENYNKSDDVAVEAEEDNPLEITAEVPIEQVLQRERANDEVVTPNQALKEDVEEVKAQPTIPFTTVKMDEIRKSLKAQGVSEVTTELPSTPFPFLKNNDKPLVDDSDKVEETEPEEIVAEPEINVPTQKISDTADFQPVTDEAEVSPVNEEEPQETSDTLEFKQQSIMDIIVNKGAKHTEPMKEVLPDIDVNEIQIPAPDVTDVIDVQKGIAADIQKFMDNDVEDKTERTEASDGQTTETEKVQEEEEITLDEHEDRLSMTLDPMLKYEADGQIGLDFDTPKKPEKEITGQLSIEEVLRSLEQRGILKAETVNEAVQALDKAEAAASKASEEVAQAEEEARLNETVVEEISVEDLGGAVASDISDTDDGIEFTEEVDTDTVQKALEAADRYEKEQELLAEEEEPEEIPIELETRPTDTGSIPVLDLSFDAPVKKLHPGISPSAEQVVPNTASLQELFADLDEATKREIGIVDEEPEMELEIKEDTNDDISDDSDYSDAALEAAIIGQAEVEIANEQTEAETEDNSEPEEEETIAETASKPEEEEKTTAETALEPEEEELQEEEIQEEVVEIDEEQKEEAKQESEMKPEETPAESAIPKISVSTNENLSATRALNIDKVVVSDEELKAFESFRSINGLEQKIIDATISLTVEFTGSGNSKKGNIMILGDEKSGKTTLAIELIKLINKKRERGGRRIAKVDSSVLNTRGIRSSMKKLVGSDLIVENAQYLRKSVLNEFVAISKYYTDDMLIVFEGETAAMKKMRGENPEIEDMFDHLLVIKEYDVKEWVAYARKYAAEEGYMIDEMGILALYKAIDDFYGKHQGIDQNDVETIVNRAIKKASKKVTRKITNLFSGKNDDNGMDILKEVDFR